MYSTTTFGRLLYKKERNQQSFAADYVLGVVSLTVDFVKWFSYKCLR